MSDKTQNEKIMKKIILTLGKLRELIEKNQTNRIKMLGYENFGLLHSFKIKDYDGYSIVDWSFDYGDPSIELHNEDSLIDRECDTSDSDYEYTLYIEDTVAEQRKKKLEKLNVKSRR